MADLEHKNITDPNRHEPKGASTASLGTVYKSDGAGSGSWADPLVTVKNQNLVTLNVTFTDISTAESIFVTSPIAGIISKIYVVLYGAINTADSIVTAKILGVAVTNSSITVAQSGSAAGTVFNSTPTAARTVAAGGAIEILTDGASSGVARATVTLFINTA